MGKILHLIMMLFVTTAFANNISLALPQSHHHIDFNESDLFDDNLIHKGPFVLASVRGNSLIFESRISAVDFDVSEKSSELIYDSFDLPELDEAYKLKVGKLKYGYFTLIEVPMNKTGHLHIESNVWSDIYQGKPSSSISQRALIKGYDELIGEHDQPVELVGVLSDEGKKFLLVVYNPIAYYQSGGIIKFAINVRFRIDLFDQSNLTMAEVDTSFKKDKEMQQIHFEHYDDILSFYRSVIF